MLGAKRSFNDGRSGVGESVGTITHPGSFAWANTSSQTEVAMTHLYQLVGRSIAMIAVCAFLGVLAGCAELGGGAGEGSSSPPPDSGNYVFPPPDLQVYD